MKIGIISNPNKAAKIERIARLFVSIDEGFRFDVEDVLYVINTADNSCQTLYASPNIDDISLYSADLFLSLFPHNIFDHVIVGGKQAVVSDIRWDNDCNLVEYLIGDEWVPYFNVTPIIDLTGKVNIGDVYYSPLCGECTCVNKDEAQIVISATSNEQTFTLNKDGRMAFSGEVLIYKDKYNKTW